MSRRMSKMKHKMQKWIALLLAVVIALAPVQSVWAESADDSLPFVQVSNATAPDLREPVDTEAAELCAPEDQVRVSIVLESASTLERGFATAEIATDRAARAYRAGLQQEQQRLTQAISRQALSGEALDVVWNLTLAAKWISANVAYGQIEAIEAVSGVREVILETRYEPTVYSRDGAQPNMSTSQEMIGTAVAYAADYTGAGMRIAVIDTGTDTDHQSFDAGAFDYAIAEEEKANGQAYDLLDAAEISAVLTQLNAYKRDPSVTAEALYGTTKLPFNYNYVDGDYDVTHDNDAQGEHGSHVAGIAVANRYVPTEDGYANALEEVLVQGVAPDAQLITMKVFGKTGGAYDSDYMAAIEDAILLGCDAINLSLGSVSAGFATNQTYQSILDRLADTDTVLTVSAGNSGAWADGAWNGHLYSEDVNFDTVGAPGSYTNTFTVASADNVGYTGQYLSVADRMMFYLETEYYAFPIATLAGQTFDYVLLDGIGDYGAWDGIDLTGKVAVCFRGEISFSSKAQYAADAGAAAIIICNNEPGSIYMDLSYYYGDAPCVSLGQEDGAWMLEQGTAVENENGEIWYYTGQVTVSSGVAATVNSEPITMSSFSSWGVPGTLELKPEITAPGGNIYSVNGLIPGGESYETMSGTSMAAPQIAGMSALVAQYIRENDLTTQTGLSPRVLAQSLLMSTAQPLTDATSGSYYPVIQQGAGLANVGSAISAGSYVLVEGQPDGKVKAELGDDPERTGVYSFTFTLNNLTDAAQDYLLSAELFTQDLFEDYASSGDEINAQFGNEYNTAWFLSKTTTLLDADVRWTVDGAPVELQPGLARMDFDGNGVIDRDDAQALLDYASGNRSELSALTYADLDGSGDVTTYDAYLFLRGLNGGAVTLPANGKMEITVTMTLTEAQKQALDAQYPSGAYVQGYICAAPATTAEGVMGVTHSIPVLAFYGNWSDASMFEVGTWLSYDYDVEEKQSYMGYVTVNYVTGLSAGYGDPYVWGGNLASFLWYNEDYLPERATLNNLNGDSLSQYVISPIRNAAAGKMEIVDVQTGEVYKSRILDAMSAEFYYTEAQQWYQTEQTANLNWFGTDANGEPLPEGTQAEVRVTLASEYYVDQQTGQVDWSALGAGATLSTLVTIDNTAPVITGVAVDPLNGTLTVTAQDNQYVAAVSLNDPVTDNGYGTKTPNQQTPGETVSITYEYLEYFTGDRLQIVVYDYAANMTTYEVMVGEIFGNEVELTEFGMYHGQYWYLFNHDSSTDWATYDIQNQVCSLTDLQAAADVDGKVFLITKSGELYVQDESLTGDCLYICKLNAVVTDLAYNPADGMLYGVSEADGLVRIDLLTGDCEAVGMPGVPTGTLACDQTGTFYCMSCEDNGLYRFTLDTLDAPELLGKFEYSETWMDWETGEEITETEEYGVNGTEQSLEWSCNDGMLYWAQYHNPDYGWVTANFLQIDLTTLECTQLMDFLSDAAVALFVRDTDRSGKAQWTEPVQQADRIELSTSVMSMKVNEEAALTASVLPWTAADRNVIWSSSDSSVAIVDENGSVKALSAGSCTITATSVLSPEVTASCKVTVEQVELSLKGAVSNENGQSKLFTWAIGQDSVWTPGAELDFFPASAAYVQQTGALYLQGTDNSLTMYQVDESSGETLAVSGQALSGIPAWDMAACEFIGKPGEAVSIYGPYIGSPSSLAENAQVLYGFDFSYYLMMVTNCTSFVAVASGGYESVTVQEYQEDGTLADQSYDGERF